MNNKKCSVLVQMDPLSKVNFFTDSTICIIKEGLLRGHEVFFCEQNDIVFYKQEKLVRCKKFELINNVKVGVSKKRFTLLYSEFHIFFLRKDPPFDIEYLTNLHMHIIQKDIRKKNKPVFVNCPSGILTFSEKLYALDFPSIVPETCVFNSFNDIVNFQTQKKKIIVKPLYDKGGSGVFLIKDMNSKSLAVIKKLTSNFKKKIIVQEFLHKVSNGDKRILLIKGEPVGAVMRVPASNNFKANLHLGAKAVKTKLTANDLKICKLISPSLIKNGLFFVGIDVIDGKLTEINVTSPTGIIQINSLNKMRVEKKLWEKIENEL